MKVQFLRSPLVLAVGIFPLLRGGDKVFDRKFYRGVLVLNNGGGPNGRGACLEMSADGVVSQQHQHEFCESVVKRNLAEPKQVSR